MRGSIFERRKGSGNWTIKVDIGRDPVTGKRRSKWHTVRGTKRDAERERTRILGTLDNKTYVAPNRETVSEFLSRWLDTIRHGVRPKTFERYEEIVERHLKPQFGALRLSQLEKIHIAEAWARGLTSGRLDGKGGLAPQTIKHHHRVLSQALDQAVEWNFIPASPARGVKLPKVQRKEMTILDQGETREMLKAFMATKLYMQVLIAATTGMRRSEILGVRWRDVDLDAADLKVTQVIEQTRTGLRFHPPKTTSSLRSIALPILLVEALRRHKASQARDALALGMGRDANRLVISSPDGSPMPPEYLTREFGRQIAIINKRRAAQGHAPLPKIRFHDLRHTHISLLLIAKEHPKVVSERAGNATVAITLGIYGHLIPGMQEGAARRVDELLGTTAER